MNRQQMYARIDAALALGEGGDAALAETTAALWREAGCDRAVLVMDMSGFTRITRARGIVAFLAEFRRAIAAVMPILRANHVHAVKTAADNVMASFEHAHDAITAAYTNSSSAHWAACGSLTTPALNVVEAQEIDRPLCWAGDAAVDREIGRSLIQAQQDTAEFLYLMGTASQLH